MGSIPELGRSLGKGNGNPNIPTWEILWTEEPGGLHSMGLQRVQHDLATKQEQQVLSAAAAKSLQSCLTLC